MGGRASVNESSNKHGGAALAMTSAVVVYTLKFMTYHVVMATVTSVMLLDMLCKCV